MASQQSSINEDDIYLRKKTIFFIEGCIGAGKSTFVETLKKSKYFENKYPDKNIIFICEPVDQWINYKDCNNVDILTHFYRDQEKFSFSFQWYVFMTRIKAIKEKLADNDILVIERSIFTDKNVFIKTLKQKDKITDIEYKIYNDWFNWIQKEFLDIEYKFVYLNLPTSKCYERIKKRARTAEDVIDYDYLDLINKNHDIWLLNNKNHKKVLPILATYDINNDAEMLKIYDNIDKFIQPENNSI